MASTGAADYDRDRRLVILQATHREQSSHQRLRSYRWGDWVARHPRRVLTIWAILLAISALAYPSLRRALGAPNYGVTTSQSAEVEQLLNRLTGQGAERDLLVFYAPHQEAAAPEYRATVARVLAAVEAHRGVERVLGPYDAKARGQISRNRHAAVAVLGLGGSPRERAELARMLGSAVSLADRGPIHAWLTGFSPITNDLADVESRDVARAEEIGLPISLLVLVLVLSSLAAAVLPLLVAGAGLLLAYGALSALATSLHFDIFILTIVPMIGLGTGIDYALFLVSRFREEIALTNAADTNVAARSVGVALATSGHAVLCSGLIVAASMSSLLVVSSPIFHEIAVGVIVTVICTLTASLTLLPAVLVLLGPRIDWGSLPARMQPGFVHPTASVARGGWARWARMVMRRPIVAAALPAVVLLVACVPLLGLRSGIDLGIASLSKTPSGEGARVLTTLFTPGAISPIEVLTTGHPLNRIQVRRATALALKLSEDKRVAGIGVSRSRTNTLLSIIPSVSIDSPRAEALISYIRDDLVPRIGLNRDQAVLVGGTTAQFVDLSNETRAKFPIVVALVLGLALVLLLVAFRSVLVSIKAVLLNLLVTGATVGLVVFVFQDGHGESVLGFSNPGFIQVYLPLTVFALLFGVSMDYEVLLIYRMREVWETTRDNRLAVASGVAHTARPITGAAAIMVAVFGSFLTANVLELKQFGFALAMAIALDATLARLMLVPALMSIFGARNWWLPEVLAKLLPSASSQSGV